MEKRVYSVFNIEGYYGNSAATAMPEGLEVAVKNDFDINKFKHSLEEHKKSNEKLHEAIAVSSESIDEFNGIIKRIGERGKRLKPFNVGLIRVLKYSENKIFGIPPLRKILTHGVEGYSTEQLIGKYCGFFEEQAVDFGEIFLHVVERENSLIDYSNDLVRRDVFYLAKRSYIEDIIAKNEGIDFPAKLAEYKELSDNGRRSLICRAETKRKEITDARKVVDNLTGENGKAMKEVDGLLKWCSGMKNVLALAKERMDNYATHLSQTLTTYMQVTSLQKGFKETNTAIGGLVEVMVAAQETADGGLNDVVNFVKSNGIYARPIENIKVF